MRDSSLRNTTPACGHPSDGGEFACRHTHSSNTKTSTDLREPIIMEGESGVVSEWSKEHAWKVCIRQRIVGSNPTHSARFSSQC